MSAADREHQLWEASGQYVRGEISSERLEQLELASSLIRKDAIFLASTRNFRRYILITSSILSAVVIVLTVVIFAVTRSSFSFVLLVGLIPSLIEALYSLIRYLTPTDDKFYQAKALKLQEKERNKKQSLRS